MREPYGAGGAAVEGAMGQPQQCPQGGRLLRPQLEDELCLIADMRELVGEQRAAQDSQTLTAGRGLERAVVDVADQLGRDEDVEVELEPGEPAYTAEYAIGPVPAPRRDAVLLHELAQQARMALLLTNEELRDPRQELIAVGSRKAAGRPQEAAALRLLAELECGEGAGDEPALLGSESARRAAGSAARLLRVILEMVQPDPEIREHGNVRLRA